MVLGTWLLLCPVLAMPFSEQARESPALCTPRLKPLHVPEAHVPVSAVGSPSLFRRNLAAGGAPLVSALAVRFGEFAEASTGFAECP